MKKQQGFSAIGVILIVVAVALVGVIGWRAYEASKNKSNNQGGSQSSNQANTQGNVNDSSSQNGNQQTPPANTATYLDIKEMGIKIKLSDDIKDAFYYYDTSQSEPFARISTRSLVTKGGSACDATKATFPLGSIQKSQSLTLPWGATLKVNNTNVFQIGSSYLIYSTPNQPCGTDAATSTLEQAQLQSFKAALPSLQSDQ